MYHCGIYDVTNQTRTMNILYKDETTYPRPIVGVIQAARNAELVVDHWTAQATIVE
jgi:hypothetical protein